VPASRIVSISGHVKRRDLNPANDPSLGVRAVQAAPDASRHISAFITEHAERGRRATLRHIRHDHGEGIRGAPATDRQTPIRTAHMQGGCVFGNVDPDGTRLTDLADRAHMTKQSVGEVVTDLQRLGYVERIPDPSDGRAKIIRLTAWEHEGQALGWKLINDIERDWTERCGADQIAALREALEAVTADSARSPDKESAVRRRCRRYR
jgi:DNA-binding MarR family transcriptional regulator